MPEDYLNRRAFLLLTAAASTPVFLLNSCGTIATKPTIKSTPSPQVARGLPQISLDTITSARLGINIHQNEPQHNDDAMIAKAGIGFVRVDFPWANIERHKGNYDFSVQEKIIKVFAGHGIQAVATLAYNNPLYDTKSKVPFHTGPHTAEVQQAFARFAAASAMQFKQYGVVWEIWNEPNNFPFWKPIPSAADYMDLAKGTAKAIRQVDPSASIIAPALITAHPNIDIWNFLGHCFQLGLLEIIDAVSMHPYREKPPETVIEDYQHLRTLAIRYAPNKKDFPIVSSEWGYPVTALVSRDLQAELLVRQFLINSTNGVLLSIWYDWHDDGQDANNPLQNFGMLAWNYQPKPAYFAALTMMEDLKGFRFMKRVPQADVEDFVFLFAQDTVQKLVVWTIKDPHSVSLRVTTPSVVVVSMTGARQSIASTDGKLTIGFTGAPQYLLAGIKS